MKNEQRQTGGMSPVIHSMLDHLAQEFVQPDQVNLWPKVRERLVQKETRSRPKEFFSEKASPVAGIDRPSGPGGCKRLSIQKR